MDGIRVGNAREHRSQGMPKDFSVHRLRTRHDQKARTSTPPPGLASQCTLSDRLPDGSFGMPAREVLWLVLVDCCCSWFRWSCAADCRGAGSRHDAGSSRDHRADAGGRCCADAVDGPPPRAAPERASGGSRAGQATRKAENGADCECPRGDLNPHSPQRELAPQASASAYSATRTWRRKSCDVKHTCWLQCVGTGRMVA